MTDIATRVAAAATDRQENFPRLDLERYMVPHLLPTCMVDPVVGADTGWVPELVEVQFHLKHMGMEMLPSSPEFRYQPMDQPTTKRIPMTVMEVVVPVVPYDLLEIIL